MSCIDWRVTRRRHRPAASRPAGLDVDGAALPGWKWCAVAPMSGEEIGAAIKAKGDEIRDKKAK
jgi:hypothetical protein